jgi:exodeoxyribonuclease-5
VSTAEELADEGGFEWEYAPALDDGPQIALNPGQAIAVDEVREWQGLPKHERPWMAVTGAAGTGKTTVLKHLRGVLPERTIWAALTGKAAARMREAAGVPAMTLHHMLYMPPSVDEDGELVFGRLREPPYGAVLVVDEASMITPQLEADLRKWTQEAAMRILFVGDGFQLPPIISKAEIEKGATEDYTVFSKVSGPALTECMRSGDAVLDAATMLRKQYKLPTTSRGGYRFRVENDPLDAAVTDYLADPEDHAVITWTNRSRMTANQIIRARLGITEERPQVGEPVLVCKNGRTVLNGEVYTIAAIERGHDVGPVPTWDITTTTGLNLWAHGWSWDGELRFEDRADWKAYRAAVEWRALAFRDAIENGYGGADIEPVPITYGHVLTAHKAQGSEYRRVTVFMPKMDNASRHFRKDTVLPSGAKVPFGIRWFYTACTRARKQLTVIAGR